MRGNAQKTPLQQSVHSLVDEKSQNWLSRLPQSMPATVKAVMGRLVQVTIAGDFKPFTLPTLIVPKAEPQWIATPTQVGDPGVILGINYYIGGQSGIGGGQADRYPRANLTNAVFLPITNKAWTTPDQNAVTLTAPHGALIETQDQQYYINVESAKIVVRAPISSFIYLGGDPDKDGGTYEKVQSVGGAALNVYVRTA
jgi:hypothetical protein